MKSRFLFTLLLLACLCCQCDCVHEIDGVVLDADSGEAIAGAIISSDPNLVNEVLESDTNGYFFFSDVTGGGFKCPELILYFSKEGYHWNEKNYPSSKRMDTIYLQKQ